MGKIHVGADEQQKITREWPNYTTITTTSLQGIRCRCCIQVKNIINLIINCVYLLLFYHYCVIALLKQDYTGTGVHTVSFWLLWYVVCTYSLCFTN